MQAILKINLTTVQTSVYQVPDEWQREYLGGGLLAARLLYDVLTPDLDPLSPEAPLLFLNGPLSGTSGPAVGRFVICGRSPYTGIWGESNCGGFWGPELRKCGYDGLWITGKAPQPVYLWIHNNSVKIHPAQSIWGLETYASQYAILQELEKEGVGASVAVIGPAGENQIPFALILTDHGRVAGRTGMGAVMGAKNLKAVAVRGRGPVPVADVGAYSAVRTEANKNLRSDPQSSVLRQLGSAGSAEYFDYLGTMPKKYYQSGTFPEPIITTGSYVSETFLDGVSACHACVIACGRVVRLLEENGTKGERRKGPEYETMMGFGPNLMLNDPEFATLMGELCDRLGMDSISASGTLGLAYLLFEQGKITPEDTGGRQLTWGDQTHVSELLHMIAQRQGFGAYLAEGSRMLGRRYGSEEAAAQVKGLETAFHDPRGATGMALSYATSPIGASHNHSDYFMADLGQVEPELGMVFHSRLAGAEKAANVALHQDWRTIFNALVICFFANVSPKVVLDLVNTSCGLNLELEDLLRIGERGWQLKRVINHRLGVRREHDTLPEVMQKPYLDDPAGPKDGFKPEFNEMLDAYYQVRDWDLENGFPSRERLEMLNLGWAANDLESILRAQKTAGRG